MIKNDYLCVHCKQYKAKMVYDFAKDLVFCVCSACGTKAVIDPSPGDADYDNKPE